VAVNLYYRVQFQMGPSHIIPVQLVRLGRLGYSGALAVQHHFQKANLECSPAESCHTLLVVEHNPGTHENVFFRVSSFHV